MTQHAEDNGPRLFFRHWITPSDIPESDLDACYKLIRGIKSMYDSSGMGWDPKGKKEEMRMSDLEYFIVYEVDSKNNSGIASRIINFFTATDTNDDQERPNKRAKTEDTKEYTSLNGAKVVAFLSLQPIAPEYIGSEDFEEDSEDAGTETSMELDQEISKANNAQPDSRVSYIYEIHISKAYRSRGLGKQLLEKAKRRCAEEPVSRKLMLTVFKVNKSAQNFYLWNGFTYYKEDDEEEEVIPKAEEIPGGLNNDRNDKKWHKDIKNFGSSRVTGYIQMEWVKPDINTNNLNALR